jgi:hypothetical protein
MMNEDMEELKEGLRRRMMMCGGLKPEHFLQAVRQDPLLLRDLFQTFSSSAIVDVKLDEAYRGEQRIGVWILRRGETVPIFGEMYTAWDQNETTES